MPETEKLTPKYVKPQKFPKNCPLNEGGEYEYTATFYVNVDNIVKSIFDCTGKKCTQCIGKNFSEFESKF